MPFFSMWLRFAFGAALTASTAVRFVAAAVMSDPVAGTDGKPDAAQLEFFEKRIRPILADRCYKCHSTAADKSKGGLLLDTREGVRQGGDSGHAVVPGNLEESLLFQALRWQSKDLRMPPQKEGGKLPDNVVADFETWVKMGAPDPRDGVGQLVKQEIDFDKAKRLWAFRVPQIAPPPSGANVWPRTDVDRFIVAAQEAKGLKPVGDAPPRALIRRLYFDLIGLPPSPQDVEEFLAQWNEAQSASGNPNCAIEKVVDRLLASPRFGERWGRHWLDVARYAESTGKERNFTFPTAWRYRDWVIAAFNADKPYDEFIREQIAGDLLPAKDATERDTHLIATGFLALGPKSLNEKNREQFRMDLIDEQIDATSRAILGITVACARCHDHKFDPIPQREYYSLAGIFRSSETHFGTGPANPKNRNGTSLLDLSPSARPAQIASPASRDPALSPGRNMDDESRVAAFLANRPRQARRFALVTPARKAEIIERILAQNGGPAAAKSAGKNARGLSPQETESRIPPEAMGVTEGRPTNARIYIRGEIDSPSEAVTRGFLTVMTNGPAPSIPQGTSGRLELADWLTAPSNPLTARVMVNRIWQHLFGQGLVRTPDNFGATGEKPSHPELLDTLAVQFMQPAGDAQGMGWSVKKLIRALVLSRTYQLGGELDQQQFAIDPDNVFLWRAAPRRLDAEAIRDAMLAASGQLDLRPPNGSIIANIGDGYIGRGIRPETFSKARANYRSVYLPIVRDFVPDVLDIFDFAEPSLVVAVRDATNVPSQALFLMNNDFVREQAAAMARRIRTTSVACAEQIPLAYRLTLSREPTAAERVRAENYLIDEARALLAVKGGNSQEAAQLSWATFCQALFASAEFRLLNAECGTRNAEMRTLPAALNAETSPRPYPAFP